MIRKKVTIAGLILAIGALALGFAAVGVASPGWSGAVASLTYFSLFAAWLGIGFGRGGRRAFWTGYALLGWAYLLIVSYNLFGGSGRYFFASAVVAPLYDTLHSVEGVGYEQFRNGMGGMGGMGGGMGGMGGGMGGMGGGMRSMMAGGAPNPPLPTPKVDTADFVRIIRHLEALIWATLGGLTARYFASGRVATAPPASERRATEATIAAGS